MSSWSSYLWRHVWWVVGAILLTAIIAIAGVLWWLNARQYESTDDAFIDARIITISAQISGAVSEVLVTDNQVVEAGAVLMRLDERIYQAQLDQAKAQVDQAQANIANLDAQIEAQQARIDQADKQTQQAQAALTFAQEESDAVPETRQAARQAPIQQAQQAKSNLLQARGQPGGRAGQCRRDAKAARRARHATASIVRAA